MLKTTMVLMVLLTLVLQGCDEPDRSDRQKYPRPECGVTGMDCK